MLQLCTLLCARAKPFNYFQTKASPATAADKIEMSENYYWALGGYVCAICGLKNPNKQNLLRHIHLNHGDERPFPCTKCDQCFKLKQHLVKFLFNLNVSNVKPKIILNHIAG